MDRLVSGISQKRIDRIKGGWRTNGGSKNQEPGKERGEEMRGATEVVQTSVCWRSGKATMGREGKATEIVWG